jgi:hypothetical protein
VETQPQPSGRARRPWEIAAAATVVAACAYYALVTLHRPYHLDTVLYVEDILAFLRDRAAPSAFPTRPGNAWAYLPAYALLGEAGLRWTNVVTLGATLALYLLALRRDFGETEAWASAVTLATTPAIVLTVTHLKEDTNALVLLAAALALARPGTGAARAAAAGSLTGLALLCKEFAILFVPFLAGHVYLGAARPASWRDLVRSPSARAAVPPTLACLASALAAVLLVSPRHLGAMSALTSSPYQAQLLGLGALASPQTWAAWQEAALHGWALPAFASIAVAAAVVRAEPRTVLWAASAAVALIALGTTTVTRGRVFAPAFFLVLPPAWRGVRIAIETVARAVRPEVAARLSAAGTAALALALAAWHVADLGPTLAFRNAYPPQASYFEGLRASLPADAVLYGADNCHLAAYFTARPCRPTPVDASEETARTFVGGLLDEARRRPVLLLHDFAAYDGRGTLAREVAERARLAVAYSGMGEDYHDMSWAVSVATDAARVERLMPACRRVRTESVPLAGAPAPGFELGRTVFRCGAEERVREYVAYRGHVTGLTQLDVLRAFPR